MRSFKPKGRCSKCGRVGPIWRSKAKPLDLGVPGMDPMEPAMQPDLCDDCEYGLSPTPKKPLTPAEERKVKEIMDMLFRGPHRD
jgi:hypothetical protein